jgi:LacI family transcriptional regulator
MEQRDVDGPVTIRDVAEKAGVALSSVSRVLSDHPDVSAKMRKRVEDAASELGYQPDLLAQSLRSGSTRTVGFVIRDISNPLFAVIARRCEQELRAAGYSMVLVNSDGDVEVEEGNLSLLRRRRVDGLIASLESEVAKSTQIALSRFPGPIVLLDRDMKDLNVGAVLCDHYTGCYAATADLISRGHRAISLITGSTEVRSTRERLRGYRAAFHDAGLEPDESLLSIGNFGDDYGKAETIRLAARKPAPSAFLTGGVLITAGALRALTQLGRTPGIDIALVALDEWPLFDISVPSLASVSRDPNEMGTTAARLLLDMLNGSEPTTLTVPTTYTPRESLTTIDSRPRKAAPQGPRLARKSPRPQRSPDRDVG